MAGTESLLQARPWCPGDPQAEFWACLHGVWEVGKHLTATECFDYRKCRHCGATEYKEQSQHWGGGAR